MLRRIGIRVHDYGVDEIWYLSKRIGDDGYTTVQLAPGKAIKHIKEANGLVTEEDAYTIGKTLEGRGIDISVLGCYLNYAHPDERIRKENIEKAKRYIRLAKDFGCRVVGTETGSLDPNYKPHFSNHGEIGYRTFRDSLDILMAYAKQQGVDFAIEAVAHHIINTPDRMKRIIDELSYTNLKVICDITNMITVSNYKDQDQLINSMFDLLEDQIQVVHMKDFDIDVENQSKQVVKLSEGMLNIELLARRIQSSPQMIDVIIEDIKAEDINQAIKRLKTYFE